MNIINQYQKSINRWKNLSKQMKNTSTVKIAETTNSMSKSFNSVDFARNKSLKMQKNILSNNINIPISPATCSGTSFNCNVAGSGKTRITNTTMYPSKYDFIATPMQEGGLTGNTHQLPIVHNWNNSTIETKFTKNSLKNSYGFENFQ